MASIQKKGSTYFVVIDTPRGASGGRRQKWIRAGRTKREAEAKRNELAYEQDRGTLVEPSKITLAEFLEHWLEAAARPTVEPKTFQVYEDIVRKKISPAIGHFKLSNLQPLHIQGYYSFELTEGGAKGTGLSARSVLHHHRVLKRALGQAVRWKMLPANPADGVDAPRPKRSTARTLTREGVHELLSLLQGTTLYMPTLIAAYTGMRRGEVLALKWEDVDLDRATISVRRSLEQTRDGVRFKEPKSQRGRRSIAISQRLVKELRQHRVEQRKERLYLGSAYENQGLVVSKDLGAPWRPDSFSTQFHAVVKRAGIDINFHGLRHTHATFLLEEGMNAKVVSERLGHATVSLTLDTYSHVTPGMQDQAALAIEKALA